jgi:RNA polymerase sigma factor (TIGR02999 family)
MGDITQLLAQAKDGDEAAWDRAVGLVYDDLKRIARGVLGGAGSATFHPTVLVHDCYLRLSRAGADAVVDRNHFLAVAARAMRQLMLNHARDRVALKRGAGLAALELDEEVEAIADEARGLIELDAALLRLETESPAAARVVECRIFAGMSEQETADTLGLPLRTAQRLWAEARRKLAEMLDDGD